MEEAPKDAPKDMPADECLGVLSDDATAVAGNQQSGGTADAEAEVEVGGDRVVPVGEEDAQASASKPAPFEIESTAPAEEETNISPTAAETGGGKSTSSSFAQLVKKWETYITDTQNTDTFQPMQMLQNLRLCAPGPHELPRLTLAPSTDFTSVAEGQDPFEPIILRHTHSTPLQYRPSFLNNNDEELPPPSQLDATRRSSSTPSRGSAFQQFRASSTYGAYLRSGSNISNTDGRSAFGGFPLHRSMYSGVSTSSAFNPVPSSLSTTQEDPQGEETTAIEVMDLGTGSAQPDVTPNDMEEADEVEVQINGDDQTDEDQAKPKKSAAARAARFLSDVGVLRRKKKGARGSIVTEISIEKGASSKNVPTIKEEESKDMDEKGIPLNEGMRSRTLDVFNRPTQESMYHQLDSDMDEEYDRYQSIENSGSGSGRGSDESQRTIPSPDYHPMEDDRPGMTSVEDSHGDSGDRRPAVRIQVSSNISVLPQMDNSGSSSSPDPGQTTPTSSTNSPGGATRSSATTYTSGHTTQATSTTSTTGNGSSQISETDREVMETIKEGKRRRRQENHSGDDKNNSDAAVTSDSSSSTSSTTNGYVALSGSPGPLRDGANVVADRFFKNSQSPVPHGGYPSCNASVSAVAPVTNLGGIVRNRVSSLSRKSNTNGSPTSCSLNSIDETPPIFVSYLDRQNASDLTSLREATEASSCRGDTEEREDSPAQIVGYPAMLLGDVEAAAGQENAMSVFPKLVLPSKEHLYNMLDRFRSRPPRSPGPVKGMRTMTTTPPPARLGSPAYQHHQLSPPRKIIDHRLDSNLSKPYVVRTTPSTQRVVLVSPGSYVPRPTTPLLCIPVGSPNYSPNQNRPLAAWPEHHSIPYGHMATYEEHSIEILKKDSKDEMIDQRFSSPETVASAR